jgi:hypothetical protein
VVTLAGASLALALLAGLVLGAAGCWLLLRGQLAFLRQELRDATDRLVGAWQAGATIPPRAVPPEPPPPPLDPVLREAVEQWEDPESRVAEEQRIRTWLAAGWGPVRILRELEEAHR